MIQMDITQVFLNGLLNVVSSILSRPTNEFRGLEDLSSKPFFVPDGVLMWRAVFLLFDYRISGMSHDSMPPFSL